MGFRRILRFGPSLALCAAGLGLASAAGAVTGGGIKRTPFLFDITSFTTSMTLPVADQIETVRMSIPQLHARIKRSLSDDTVEPLTLVLSDDEKQIAGMVDKLASDGKKEELAAFFRNALKDTKPDNGSSGAKTITISREGLDLMNKAAYADLFSRTHHDLTLSTADLHDNSAQREEFMKQLSPFFSKKERANIQKSINAGEPIKIDTTLLPEFARKMVRKYILYRGPNCFHAALAFQSPTLTSSSLVNVKVETGYHRAMINYDELWRVIGRGFYEINPDEQPLKYGDMLVFFDVPTDVEDDLDTPVEFRWIRHTATYLFSGYTFSKGSKSPNTPYTVRTLSEEWKTWKRYTKNLGIKVYRRSQKHVSLRPAFDLTDWVY